MEKTDIDKQPRAPGTAPTFKTNEDSEQTDYGLNQIQLPMTKDSFTVPVQLQLKATMKNALIDSGAHDSYIRKSVLTDLQLEHLIQGCEPFTVSTVTRERKVVREVVQLQLTIGTWCGTTNLFVMDTLNNEIVLGLPFVREHQKLISWKRLSFSGASNRPDSANLNNHEQEKMVAINDISMKDDSEQKLTNSQWKTRDPDDAAASDRSCQASENNRDSLTCNSQPISNRDDSILVGG